MAARNPIYGISSFEIERLKAEVLTPCTVFSFDAPTPGVCVFPYLCADVRFLDANSCLPFTSASAPSEHETPRASLSAAERPSVWSVAPPPHLHLASPPPQRQQ